jgi:hypothetical protein
LRPGQVREITRPISRQAAKRRKEKLKDFDLPWHLCDFPGSCVRGKCEKEFRAISRQAAKKRKEKLKDFDFPLRLCAFA